MRVPRALVRVQLAQRTQTRWLGSRSLGLIKLHHHRRLLILRHWLGCIALCWLGYVALHWLGCGALHWLGVAPWLGSLYWLDCTLYWRVAWLACVA